MRKPSPVPNFPRYLASKYWNLNQHSLCLKHILSTTMLSYLPDVDRELKQWVWIQWGTVKFYLHETKQLIYLIFSLNWIDDIFHSTICSLHTCCWILHIEQSLYFFLSLSPAFLFFKCYSRTFKNLVFKFSSEFLDILRALKNNIKV